MKACFGLFYITTYWWDKDLIVFCLQDKPKAIHGGQQTITKFRSKRTSWQKFCCLFQTYFCYHFNPLSYGINRKTDAPCFLVITIIQGVKVIKNACLEYTKMLYFVFVQVLPKCVIFPICNYISQNSCIPGHRYYTWLASSQYQLPIHSIHFQHVCFLVTETSARMNYM